MSLKYFVHVSSIYNLSDARYCSGMMVNSLGFDLDEKSKNKLSTDNINEISAWVNGVHFVGEFNNSSSSYINSILNEIDFDYILINIDKSIRDIDFDNKKIIVLIPDPKLITSKTNDHLNNFFPYSSRIVVDNMNKNSINKLELINNNYEIITNPLENIDTTKSYLDKFKLGLLLKGSQEIRPGYKDYDLISDYLEAIDESF